MISPQLERLLEELYETLGGGVSGERKKIEILERIKRDPEAFLASLILRAKEDAQEKFSVTLEWTLRTAAYDKYVNEARQLLDEGVTEETATMTPA